MVRDPAKMRDYSHFGRADFGKTYLVIFDPMKNSSVDSLLKKNHFCKIDKKNPENCD